MLLQCVSAQFNISFSTSAEFRGSNNGGNAWTLPSQQRRAETLANRSSTLKKNTKDNMLNMAHLVSVNTPLEAFAKHAC